jgi:protein O-GlcNAc transferase
MNDPNRLFTAATRAHQSGDLAQAASLYEKVLELNPGHADALHLRGLIASQNGHADRAASLIQRAIQLTGGNPVYYNNLGEVFRRAERLDEAADCYRRALALVPEFPEAHYNLALVLKARADFNGAIASYQRAVQGRPNYFSAWYNLANVLREEGRVDRAIEAYRRVLQIKPDHAEANINLGNALKERSDSEGALKCYRRALELDSTNTDVRGNIAQALLALGRKEEAVAEYQVLAAMQPGKWWYALRTACLIDDVAADNASIDVARRELDAALDECMSVANAVDIDDLNSSGIEPPMQLAYQGRNDRPLREQYAELFAPLIPAADPRGGTGKPHVGFVVTHGHEGVFLKCMRGILNHLSAERFRITVVCSQAGRNVIGQSVRNPAVGYLVLPTKLGEAAEAIRAAGIDLLHYWEVATDSTNYFLPYLRSASVQSATWGWPVTTGIPQMDYFVSSERLEPDGAEAHYTEKLVRLPSLPTYYYRPPLPEELHGRSHFGLAQGRNVYLCIQNVRKFHPDIDPTIGDILRRDPSGEFIFLSVKEKHMTEALLARFRSSIPDVVERIRAIPQLPEPEYLNLISVADVVLDTLHYGGGANTTYDALYAGTPIVTLPGEFHRGRFCAAAYERIGIDECVVGSPQAYTSKAVSIATDPDYRHDLRERILDAAPVLYEDINPVRELEDFFERAIATARAG